MARGKLREQAILTAAIELLMAHGYAALTMDGVAAAARASKATIYRRWANKAELVKAALDSLDSEHAATIPDTGELRRDLFAVMKALRQKASRPYVNMMTDIVGAARHDEVLAALLQQHADTEDLSPFEHVLQRAVRRGELPRQVDTALVHDVVEALVLRQLQRGLPLDGSFSKRVVDGVVLPLLTTPRRRR